MAFGKKKKQLAGPSSDELGLQEDIASERSEEKAAMDELDSGVKQKPSLFGRRNKASKPKDFTRYPMLSNIKPREFYWFHSDYYQVDDRWCTVMSFFYKDGATQGWPAFWGVNRIPTGLSSDVQIMLIDNVRVMTDRWVQEHMNVSENVSKTNSREQAGYGSNTTKLVANRREQDLQDIAREIAAGATYLHLQFRLLISAPGLQELDEVVQHIGRQYTDRFGTLSVAPYYGEQKRELSTILCPGSYKMGRGFYMTSTEFAGAYSLVTHGVEDEKGEYVGAMHGDVNNAAVLFNTNGYKRSVVVADEGYDKDTNRSHISALWGSKLSQACMLDGGRVVHLILDNTDLDLLGPKFERLTYKIDLNHGDVNMFEMFGDRKDQLAIFSSQMQKLILMAEQAYECTDSDRAIIRGSLEELATKFYVHHRMWYPNAKMNEDKLRVVGIPHDQVPKLETFCTYADSEYNNITKQIARDDERVHALSVLATTFKNLLSTNGDLFNTTTTSVIDGAETGQRVVYDFSRLLRRGDGVAMAQLVNIIGFAVGNIGEGDTLIIHGVEKIKEGIKPYLLTQLEHLYDVGGRVVFLYNNIDAMLADNAFCGYDKADYKIFGSMTVSHIDAYQDAVGQDVPSDLKKLIVNCGPEYNYIQRGFDNIVFERKLILNRPGEEGVDCL